VRAFSFPGRIHIYVSSRGEAYSDILARHDLDELTADGNSVPPEPEEVGIPAGAFAARFAEVGVDPDLGLVRVTRSCRRSTAAASSTKRPPPARSSAAP
jgi:hypothetical protein